jgi:quinol monooxygenase YgiN
VLRPQNDEHQVMLHEVYTDDAAFQVHWNGPHVARMRAETTGMVAKLSGTRPATISPLPPGSRRRCTPPRTFPGPAPA